MQIFPSVKRILSWPATACQRTSRLYLLSLIASSAMSEDEQLTDGRLLCGEHLSDLVDISISIHKFRFSKRISTNAIANSFYGEPRQYDHSSTVDIFEILCVLKSS